MRLRASRSTSLRGYQQDEGGEHSWSGYVNGVYYQVTIETWVSKGSDDWYVVSYLKDADEFESIAKEYVLSDSEQSNVVVFGNKSYSNEHVDVAALFCYMDSDPDNDLAVAAVVGRERAWLVGVWVQCEGDDEMAISLVDQIAASMTDEVETKRGKAALLEKSKARN